MNTTLKWLISIIFFLALIAALAGIWPAEGKTVALTNFRGEKVTINGRGLYYWDTVSMVAQMQANDLITLVLGLPLIAISFFWSLRGSLRGRLLLTGTIGFILYTYITMAFGAQYNSLFLIYVALFSLSLFSFILLIKTFDLIKLPRHFSSKLPRRWISGLLFFAALFLSMAWLGRVFATFSTGAIPQLENTTSMFIQVMDLGIIIPVCIISGVLLIRRHPLGYLLTSISLTKFLTLGIAVSLMGLNMSRIGAPINLIELSIFLSMSLTGILMTIILYKNISEKEIINIS